MLCVRYGGRVKRLFRREGGSVLFEIRPLYGKWKLGGLLKIQVDLQITSRVRLVVFVLHKLYHGCRPYDFCDSLALWKISPYRYSKGKKAQLYNKIKKKHIA